MVQREQLSGWEAVLEASGLPVAGLDAPKPKARLALAAPLPSGVAGEAELADLWLVERLPSWRVREALATGLPAGYTLANLYDVWLGEPPLPGRVIASIYRATIAPPVALPAVVAAAQTLLTADALPRGRRKGEATVAYDLRPFLDAIEVAAAAEGGATIRMTLRHDPARGVGRPDETLAALGETLGGEPLRPAALVREGLVLSEPPQVAPTAPRGPRPSTVPSAPGSHPLRPGHPR